MLGTITAPAFAYTSKNNIEKTTMSCCKKQKVSTVQKKSCCSKKSKSEDKGCGGCCKHKSCQCISSCISIVFNQTNELIQNENLVFLPHQIFSELNINLSKGFYSIWTPPDIC